MSDATGNPALDRHTIVERSLGVRAIQVDTDAVLFDVLRDRCLRLNRTATDIWNMLGPGSTLAAVGRELAEKYGIDEERACASARDLLLELIRLGVVASNSRQFIEYKT